MSCAKLKLIIVQANCTAAKTGWLQKKHKLAAFFPTSSDFLPEPQQCHLVSFRPHELAEVADGRVEDKRFDVFSVEQSHLHCVVSNSNAQKRNTNVDSVTVSLFANKYYFTTDLTNRYM